MQITVFISFSGQGGVERMVCNLVREFVRRGLAVDLVVVKSHGLESHRLPDSVNVIKLGTSHTWLAVWPLIRYLRQRRPKQLLAAKHRAIAVAVLARIFSGIPFRLVGRLGTNVTGSLAGKAPWKARMWAAEMNWFYPRVDKIVAVSRGVAGDIMTITGLGEDRVETIPNPVITPELYGLAEQPLDHPWFQPGQLPVILGAGRFTPQKDFPTLIRAFARLRAEHDCRLVLLGDGALQSQCIALAKELGVAQDLAILGFQNNPYPFMRHAALFVLSSAWEGSPNVLTEAMALGTPVVSTDCPSGPREILRDGQFGPLVPIGDVPALAEAMQRTLANPLPRTTLQEAVVEYTVEKSAARYLHALGVSPTDRMKRTTN